MGKTHYLTVNIFSHKYCKSLKKSLKGIALAYLQNLLKLLTIAYKYFIFMNILIRV